MPSSTRRNTSQAQEANQRFRFRGHVRRPSRSCWYHTSRLWQYALDDVLYVGVQLDDTDNSTRWIPLSGARKRSMQRCTHLEDASDTSTGSKSLEVLTSRRKPNSQGDRHGLATARAVINLLVYQLHDGAPKLLSSTSSAKSSAAKICSVVCDTSNNVLNYLYAPYSNSHSRKNCGPGG